MLFINGSSPLCVCVFTPWLHAGLRQVTRCSWWSSLWTPTCSTTLSNSSSATALFFLEESTFRRPSTMSSSLSAPIRASTDWCYHTPPACTGAWVYNTETEGVKDVDHSRWLTDVSLSTISRSWWRSFTCSQSSLMWWNWVCRTPLTVPSSPAQWSRLGVLSPPQPGSVSLERLTTLLLHLLEASWWSHCHRTTHRVTQWSQTVLKLHSHVH